MKLNAKEKYKFTIKTKITPEIYRNFARYDTFARKKKWVFPVFVFFVLMALAGICYMINIPALAAVSGVFAVAFPVTYFSTFDRIMRDNTHRAHYEAVIDDYLVSLTDEGVEIYSEEEQAQCSWEELNSAYLLSTCIALYLTRDKAFLISQFNEKRYEQIWQFICDHAGHKAKDRRTAIW